MRMPGMLTICVLAAVLVPQLVGCGGGGGSNDNPQLSESLVFIAQPDARKEVRIMSPDGAGKARLAHFDDGDTIQGLLSPNGSSCPTAESSA